MFGPFPGFPGGGGCGSSLPPPWTFEETIMGIRSAWSNELFWVMRVILVQVLYPAALAIFSHFAHFD